MNEYTWYAATYTVPTCATEQTPCPGTQWWYWLLAAGLVVLGAAKK